MTFVQIPHIPKFRFLAYASGSQQIREKRFSTAERKGGHNSDYRLLNVSLHIRKPILHCLLKKKKHPNGCLVSVVIIFQYYLI